MVVFCFSLQIDLELNLFSTKALFDETSLPFLGVVCLLLIVSCEKETFNPHPYDSTHTQTTGAAGISSLVDRAKASFAERQMSTYPTAKAREKGVDSLTLFDLTPIWEEAREMAFGANDSIVVVPYWEKTDVVPSSADHLYLVFYADGQNEMRVKIVGFEPDENAPPGSAFTGYLYIVEEAFYVSQVLDIENGVVNQIAFDPEGELSRLAGTGQEKNGDETELCQETLLRSVYGLDYGEQIGPIVRYFKFRKRNNFFSGLFSAIANFFGALTSGSGTYQTGFSATSFFTTFGSLHTGSGVLSFESNGDSGGSGGGAGNQVGGFPTDFFSITDFWSNVSQSPLSADLAVLIGDNSTDAATAEELIDLLPIFQTDCVSSYGDIFSGADFGAQYLCVTSMLLNYLDVTGSAESQLEIALKARVLQILGNGQLDTYTEFIENPDLTNTIFNFLEEKNFDAASLNVLTLFTQEMAIGLPFDEYGTAAREDFVTDNEHLYLASFEIDTGTEPCPPSLVLGLDCVLARWHQARVREEAAFLKELYPEDYPDTFIGRTKLKLHAEWRVVSGNLHTLLDLCGLIPGAGEPCDGINAIYYAIEGDGVNAVLSAASTIPFAGWFASVGKLSVKIKVGERTRGLFWFREGDAVIFNNPSGSFRKWWDFPVGTVGHHLIPKQFWDNNLVQKAAKASNNDVFHIHGINNGFPLDPSRHTGSHSAYSNNIQDELNAWLNRNPNATSEEAASALKLWQSELTTILENSSSHINFLDIPPIPDP